MRILLISSALFLFFSANVPLLHAQEDVSQVSLTTQDKLIEVHERISDKLQLRFGAYQKFTTKLESRRSKLANLGKNTSVLDNHIRLYKVELSKAFQTLRSSAQKLNYNDLNSINDYRIEIRNSTKRANQALADVHEMAQNAVSEIIKLESE